MPKQIRKRYNFIGVIWGVTDEKLNEKGELVKDENVSHFNHAG